MVSIYRLRPVYTFPYTIINGNVIASFVQKKEKFWDILVQKFFFFAYLLWDPPPPCTQSYAFGLTPLLPFVRTCNMDDPLTLLNVSKRRHLISKHHWKSREKFIKFSADSVLSFSVTGRKTKTRNWRKFSKHVVSQFRLH